MWVSLDVLAKTSHLSIFTKIEKLDRNTIFNRSYFLFLSQLHFYKQIFNKTNLFLKKEVKSHGNSGKTTVQDILKFSLIIHLKKKYSLLKHFTVPLGPAINKYELVFCLWRKQKYVNFFINNESCFCTISNLLFSSRDPVNINCK